MILQHNIAAINSNRLLNNIIKKNKKSIEKLESGYKIAKASDNAAGLAISEQMRSQIRGLEQATRNAQDAISLVQTADGALNESNAVLQRIRELSVQSANDTCTLVDRDVIQAEVNELTMEIDRIACSTEYNTMKILQGSNTPHIKNTESVTTLIEPKVNTAYGLVSELDIISHSLHPYTKKKLLCKNLVYILLLHMIHLI